jgi:HlyD family secretion protein
VSEAKDAVKVSRAQLDYSYIYSPVDATVEYRSHEPGEVISPGTSILTLVDLSNLWVRIDLEEGYIGQVKVGNKAEVTLERMPGKVFEGVVFDIGREGEFATERDVTRGRQDIKTFRTRIRVDNPENILKPGMTVLVKIPPQPALTIKVGEKK